MLLEIMSMQSISKSKNKISNPGLKNASQECAFTRDENDMNFKRILLSLKCILNVRLSRYGNFKDNTLLDQIIFYLKKTILLTSDIFYYYFI